MKRLPKLVIFFAVTLFSFISFADKIAAGEMQKICLDAFMKNVDKVSDVGAYKNFVNKTCKCTENKVSGKDVDQNLVMMSMGGCMRTTLLTETMNNLKDDASLTEDKITSACTSEWKIVTSYDKKSQGSFDKPCACAAKEIMALDKDRRTDENTLEKIATNCVIKNK